MIAVKTYLTSDGSFPIAFWMAARDLSLSFELEADPAVVTQLARHNKTKGIEVTYAFHPSQLALAQEFKESFGTT